MRRLLSTQAPRKVVPILHCAMAASCNENVATHGSFVERVTPGKFLSLKTANRNTYESRRVTISWLCKAAGQEILISDWVNTSCYSAYKIYTPNISYKM